MNEIQGNLIGSKLKIGVVVGRFNDFIVSKLLGGGVLFILGIVMVFFPELLK